MPRKCGPNKSCGIKGGLLNPFFQNGADLASTGLSSSQGVFPEYPGADLTEEVHSYASSVDTSLTALKVRVYYPTDAPDDGLPGMVIVPGFETSAVDMGEDYFREVARLGFFVMAVEMRGSSGSGGSGGTRDSGGLEPQDIDDAVDSCRSTYAKLHPERVSLIGFSHGGFNAMLLASRYPDKYQVVTNFFGISSLSDWYGETSGVRQTALQSYVGGTPAAMPNEYLSRNVVDCYAKNFMGYSAIFHDEDDTTVPVHHSQDIVASLIAESRTDYNYDESGSGSANRWVHQYPEENAVFSNAHTYYKTRAKNNSIETVPTSGTFRINGYLITKRFSIWLGIGAVRTKGKQRSADLTYNYSTDSYTITPDFETGASWMVVTIVTDTGKYVSKVISAETTLTPINPATDQFLQYSPAFVLDLEESGTHYKDGSNLVEAWVNRVASGFNIGQACTATGTARPEFISNAQNSLPVVRFAGNPDVLFGAHLQGIGSMTKFTLIVASKSGGVSIGVSDTNKIQMNYSGGNTFLSICNSATTFGQEADTDVFAVESLVFDGSLTGNANRLKYFKNGTQATIDAFTGTIPASVDFSVNTIQAWVGRVVANSTYLAGDHAVILLYPGELSTANRQTIEGILRTRYNV